MSYYNVLKRMILFILLLIFVTSCANDTIQQSEYKKLESKLNQLEEQNQILADAIKYNREYVIEFEAEYTFNISENTRKILELEKLIKKQ